MCSKCSFGIAERLRVQSVPGHPDIRHADHQQHNQSQVADCKNALDGSDLLGNMRAWKSGGHLHCILNILRLRDGPTKGDCVGDMVVMAVMLTARQQIGSLGLNT